MTELCARFIVLIAFAYFLRRRLRRYLHIYQQEEYDGVRFVRWLVRTRTVDTRLSLALLLILISARILGLLIPVWLLLVANAAALAVFGAKEPDPTRSAKKPLVMTNRATKIASVALALGVVAGICLAFFAPTWGWILGVQTPPCLLLAADVLLKPIERRTQRFFWNDAHRRILELAPTTIGITGSFGKTSVKHMLGHVLGLNARAFATPGSVNTSMGIARVIRELLPDDSKYFVVEMGAYGPGSIRRLCELTPPHVGIITAIGEAHYERFKTLETVVNTKFELASSVFTQPSGFVVLHADILRQPTASELVQKGRDRYVVCGKDASCDVRIQSWKQTARGLTVSLRYRDSEYNIEAPVYGAHNVGNLALAFGAAVSLGIVPESVVAALRRVPQTKHRLEVKHEGNGCILIDDAYNSNPVGFTTALELLTVLSEGRRRRILVTPGMVELGEKHDELHSRVGVTAGEHADVAVIIKPERIPSFVEGYCRTRDVNALVCVASFEEAKTWLDRNGNGDDVVLLENDLPDLYEARLRL